MKDAMEPGRVTFDDKMTVRKAIETAGIPFTYVSANCFAGYFLGGLCQPGNILPSKEHVLFLGDGNQKGKFTIHKIHTFPMEGTVGGRSIWPCLYCNFYKNTV